MPGVGYIELAFASSSCQALTAAAFLRPCVLPKPGRGKHCVLRCTRQATGTLLLASRTSTTSTAGSFAVNFMVTQETGHNVQFVEGNTTANKGVRSHFLEARTDHELREDATTFMLRRSVSDPQPSALGQYEPVSRWTNEVAQTQDMDSLLPPQNEETTRADINGHLRSSRFSALETLVLGLRFLCTSQVRDAVV